MVERYKSYFRVNGKMCYEIKAKINETKKNWVYLREVFNWNKAKLSSENPPQKTTEDSTATPMFQ